MAVHETSCLITHRPLQVHWFATDTLVCRQSKLAFATYQLSRSTISLLCPVNRPVTPPPNASIPTSTPISNKTSGGYTYASETHNRDSANYCLAQETSGLFLGAMPPTKFLDKFLPICQDTKVWTHSRGAFTSVLSAEQEVNMYAPFVSLVLVSVPGMLHQHSVDHGGGSMSSQFEVHRYTRQSRYRVRQACA